jgi:hypothetical protein
MFEYWAEPAPLNTTARIMLIVWFLLLLPCLIFAALSAMAFEGGYTPAAYATALTPWSYPVLLGVAFFYRRKKPHLVWLPALPLAVIALALLVGR